MWPVCPRGLPCRSKLALLFSTLGAGPPRVPPFPSSPPPLCVHRTIHLSQLLLPGLQTELLQDAQEHHTVTMNGMHSVLEAVGIMEPKQIANEK